MSGASSHSGIAVFDFDGTLTPKDSFLAFIRFTHGRWALLLGLLLHLPSILRYFTGRLPNDQLKEVLFTHFYANYPAAELKAKGKAFGEHIIPGILYQGAREKLAWHQSQGHRIVVLSASARLWLEPWCQQQQFELICSEFAIKGGCYTGKLATPNCYGTEKEHRILPLLEEHSRDNRYGYGDRTSDQHYIQHCAHAAYLPLSSGLHSFWFRAHSRWSPLLYRCLQLTFLALFISLPFSIGFDLGSHRVDLPSEPLLLLIAALSGIWFLLHGAWPRAVYRSPLMVSSLLFLAVIVFTTGTSTLFLVSAKYTFIAVLHWWVFFHALPLLFDLQLSRLLRLPLLYGLSFVLILFYAWYNHAQYDFRIDVSVLTARPFYFDHALYSCCILLLLGPCAALLQLTLHKRLFFIVGLAILLIGLYFSFSRAAWLSLILATVFTGSILLFKLRFRHLLLLAALGVALLFFGQSFFLQQLAQNSAPSKTENQAEHLRSALNITTDASNLERLNRYRCAWRMFQDRPHTGFGPGTYQFAYLPYQQPSEMTHISVSEPGRHRPGKGGGAHSEYLQALSESGWLGFLSWLLLLLTTLYTALHAYHAPLLPWHATLSIALLFSLSTYFLHGLVNNFLHHGKVAALFWTLLAILHFTHSHRQLTS